MRALTVYCSSSTSLDPLFHDPARAVGRLLAEQGVTLVYGGGGIGLMGEVARAARGAGGRITGIITQTLLDREQGYDGCDDLIVTSTMQERKRKLLDLGDAFLMLPGGLGTWEEFLEALVARVVGEHVKPLGILNTDGYFDPLLELIEHGIDRRFIRPAVRELTIVGDDPAVLLSALRTAERAALDHARFLPMGERGGSDAHR